MKLMISKEQSILKEFLRYMSTNVAGMVAISAYILADTLFIARGIGELGLAALNIALPGFSIPFGFGLMIGMGSATKYNILKAQSKDEEANKVFTTALILAVIVGLCFSCTGLIFSEKISVLFGANEETLSMANTYLKIILIFAPAFMLNSLFISFVRNDGYPGLAMIAMISGSFFNTVFDYIFIFPMGMGILGAVLATGVSPIVSMFIMLSHKLKKNNKFKLVTVDFDLSKILEIFKLGLSSFISELATGLVMILFNILILGISGNVGIAAYGVIANMAMIVTAMYSGVAQGMQPLSSTYYAKNDTRNMFRVYIYALISVLVISICIYTVFYIYAPLIAAIFDKGVNETLRRMATTGLRLYFLAMLPLGFNIISAILFMSVERALSSQIIALCRGLVIIVPTAIILSKLFNMQGIWLSVFTCEIMVAFISVAFLRKFRKDYIKK